MKMESIIFETDEGEVEFYVLEQTTLGGKNYILVTDDVESEEGTFLILKDVSGSEEEVASYEIVEEKDELESVAKIFNELIDDFDLEV